MRTGLKNINNVRKRFIATFSRYGKKTSYKGSPITTLLFLNIRDKDGVVYCDHIWFNTSKQFAQHNFNEGEDICFDARVKKYTKGYRGRRDDEFANPIVTDYKLSHPNNITKEENTLFETTKITN